MSMYIKYKTKDNTEYYGNLQYFIDCHVLNNVTNSLVKASYAPNMTT
jgi:hypothetical protein